MKIKVQKSGPQAAKPATKPAKAASRQNEAQLRDLALNVVEQGLKKPAKPRPERSEPREKRPARPAEPEHTPSSVRLFFALKVPASVSGRLAETQRKLKGNWRTVRPDQMHVTLTYMPAVPLNKVEAVKKLGTELLRGLPPLDLKLRGTGYFPNEGSPRVWFVKVEATGLDDLAEQLRLGVAALGVETDDLAFRAHITLARKKGPAPRVPPLTFDLGWTATGAALFRSHLRKTGPIYEVQSTFRFLGEPPTDPQQTAVSATPPPSHPADPAPTSTPTQTPIQEPS